MTKTPRPPERSPAVPNAISDSRETFLADLKHRRRAASAMEREILTEVPLLYGEAGCHEPKGDPGIVLAELHAADRAQRHGSGLPRQTECPDRIWISLDKLFAMATLLFVILYYFDIIH